MEKRLPAFCFFLLNNFFSLGFAAEDKPIIVSVEKFERPYERSSSTIIKLDNQAIKKSGATNVAELLKNQAGVNLFTSGAFGKASSLFLRGTSNRHTLVVIDGMRVTDLTAIGGGSRLEFLSTSDIESIEVLKGSQGVLYGGEAIGGVLRITTKKSSTEQSSRFKMAAGSFGQLSFGGITKLSKDNSLGSLQVSHDRAEGISTFNEERTNNAEADNYETTHVRYKNNIELKSLDVEINSFFQDSQSQFDSSSRDVIGNETGYQTYGVSGLAKFKVLETLRPTVSLEYRRVKTDSTVFSNNNPSFFLYDGSSIRSEVNLPFVVSDSLELLSGVSWEAERADALDSAFESTRARNRFSAFSQARKEFGAFFSEVGTRFESIESIDKRALYRAAFGFNFNSWTLKAHQATGFKAPSLYQNFSAFGNRDLLVERSLSRELSALYLNPKKALKFELAIFSINYSNFVDFDNSTNRYENLGAQENTGVEASFAFELLGTLVSAEANFLRAINPDNGEYALRRPRQRYSLGLERKLASQWLTRINGVYVGDRQERNQVRMPSYLTFDLHLAYNYDNERNQITLDFKNILDREYEEIRNFGTPGRNILVSWERAF